MPRQPMGPLTDADYRRLNEELRLSEMARQEIDKAKEAGFPCGDEDMACRAMHDQLTRIKKVYFPERP